MNTKNDAPNQATNLIEGLNHQDKVAAKILASLSTLTAKIKKLFTRKPRIVQLFDDPHFGTFGLDSKGRVWKQCIGGPAGMYWSHRPTPFHKKRGQQWFV